MRFLQPALALIAVLSVAAPLSAQNADAPANATEALPAITVTAATARHMQDRVLTSGLIGPVEQVLVAPLVEGQPIEELLADVGDQVQKGQVLARLSDATLSLQKSQLTASLATARATIAQAEAQLLEAKSSADEASRVAARTAALKAQGSASNAANDQVQAQAVSATARVTVAAQSLEAARAQVTMVEAQIANVDLQLSRTSVVAPVAGQIVQRNAQLGGIASAAGQPMFVLIRDGALELRADVAEGDLMRLAKDQTVTLTLAGSAETLAGHIRLVEPGIDTTSRLGRVRIAIDDSSRVRSGMFAEASVLAAERDALAVPVTAVGSEGGKATVMAVVDGTVHRVAVKTGIRDDGWIEIVSGLAAGDTIVAKAGAFVRDGDKINPVPAAAETN